MESTQRNDGPIGYYGNTGQYEEITLPLSYYELTNGDPHQAARALINAKMVKMATEAGIEDLSRYPVPDEFVGWDVELPGYNPTFVDVPRGNTRYRLEEDRPDPDDPRLIESFTSLETSEIARDKNGYPLNPIGRTGLTGRGMLNQWGATFAADPIVTRHNPRTGQLEVLLIRRDDTGDLAIPGGKLNPGELPWQAAGRELIEEAATRNVELDFRNARVVFAGYVDDPRNTDNAWMETTAYHLHLDEQQANSITVEAGSDAQAAEWVIAHGGLRRELYGNQGEYLSLAL